MNTTSHDFVSVDMRGMKAALVARVRAERVSVSAFVRAAVAQRLGLQERTIGSTCSNSDDGSQSGMVKLSIRLTREETSRLAEGARRTGLSRGAYLSGLIGGVPILSGGSRFADHRAALVASSAELSSLVRNIHHLTSVLQHGSVRAALEYRDMLDTLAADVRAHLRLAGTVLLDLRPRGRFSLPTARSCA